MQHQSPFLRLWELGESEHGGLIRAIISAAAGVLCGMLPYYAAAQIMIALLSNHREWPFYLAWCGIGMAGYILRACLYAMGLSLSHRATFTILKNIRGMLLDKLPKLHLGTVMDTSSGKMKQIIVEQVESMEMPLAHLLPEMTCYGEKYAGSVRTVQAMNSTIVEYNGGIKAIKAFNQGKTSTASF